MEILQNKRLWIAIAVVVVVVVALYAAYAAGLLGGGTPQSDAPAQQETTTQ